MITNVYKNLVSTSLLLIDDSPPRLKSPPSLLWWPVHFPLVVGPHHAIRAVVHKRSDGRHDGQVSSRFTEFHGVWGEQELGFIQDTSGYITYQYNI